ncbi:TrbI/VirB10 family protein [Ferrimonas balearica]|uniref:TrbI/VirB10 family protein n=1 Tax=Ferrimonas balearica TaxID=44012 RepID=UPI001C97C50D|nr:TrbI/VirB10 family protein [Ferrimonas balearica]MBY5979215.1 hypothetical protein [Ferrimonas balearica]
MVKVWIGGLLLVPLLTHANEESLNSYEVGRIAQKANQEAQQKAARQKSEPDEMLKLLSTLEAATERSKSRLGSEAVNASPTPSDAPSSEAVQTAPETGVTRDVDQADGIALTPASESRDSAPDSFPPSTRHRALNAESVQKELQASRVDETEASEATPTAHTLQSPQPPKVQKPRALPSSIYVPSPDVGGPSNRSTGRYGAVVRGTEYGILFGRWVRARIEREVNSGDSGEIEIILEQDLVGKYRTIPAGTIIYANKGFNNQTRRLAIQTRRAVTPDNLVIPTILASAFDNTRRAGLSGYIERNREEVYQDAAGNTLIKLANSAVNAALPADLSGVTDAVADLEAPQGNNVPYTIKVQPQSFWLRIDESL